MEEIRLLHVDDDPDDRLVIRTYLLELRPRLLIESAESAERALELLGGSEFDCVLCDYVLPGITGLEFLNRLRSLGIDIPFILLTGQGNEEVARRAIRAGVSDYWTKDYDTAGYSQLLRRIENLSRVRKEVAEREKAERALRESERRYRLIVDTAEEAIFTYSAGGNFNFVNSKFERMTGYGAGEVIGRSILEFIAEPDRRGLLRKINNRHRGRSEQYEFKFRRKDGTEFWGLVSAGPISGDDGSFRGGIAMITDITERKAALERDKAQQQQLAQASKLASLGILISGVAHEVNNPNHFILSNSTLLRKAWESIEPILDAHLGDHGEFDIGGVPYSRMKGIFPKALDDICEGSKRIRKIVAELRDFANSRPEESMVDVDLNSVVDSAAALLANIISGVTSRFEADLAEPPPVVRGNPQRLEQVVINLLTNACQALRNRNGLIRVRTRRPGGQTAVLIVEDEGVGIDTEVLEHLTDPFFTTRRDEGGTGLGLSISATIVREHGGRLEFESERGRGTTAKVTLPLLGNSE